jgi:hypothetical protein
VPEPCHQRQRNGVRDVGANELGGVSR